jgi:hypothetical protein
MNQRKPHIPYSHDDEDKPTHRVAPANSAR